jgi:hypothetical protein
MERNSNGLLRFPNEDQIVPRSQDDKKCEGNVATWRSEYRKDDSQNYDRGRNQVDLEQ